MLCKLAIVSCSVALAASPALAGPLGNAEVNEILGRAMTPVGDLCHDSWGEGTSDSGDQIIAKCQTAIAEVQALRAKEAKLTPGVRTLYAGTEAMLEQGLVMGYSRKGGNQKATICQHEERIWALLSEGDLTSVSSDIAKVMTEYHEITGQLVSECRKQFGTPAGAAKI